MSATHLSAEFQARQPEMANDLGPENLERLLEACIETKLPAQRRLFRDRMPADSVYFVLEGELVATIDNNGQTIEVGRIHPGAWLGEVAVLSGNRLASSNVSSVTDCRLLKLRAQDFEDFALNDEEISHVLMGQMVALLSERLRSSNAAATTLENT
ncbi:MAG TPA: cyclic nucleotide-binding domain-containing protein [Rhodocyclaceae bacterium]|jgi:CRP-like cAMP-binding protein|nr:cyclic nucleotide-binding domain-containing protein [Rhodocyclaceae bacterium]